MSRLRELATAVLGAAIAVAAIWAITVALWLLAPDNAGPLGR